MPSRNLALPFIFPESPTALPEADKVTREVTASDLWLCIHLPNLSLAILETPGDKPHCVLTEFSGRWLIHSVCEMAAEYGILPGMPLNAAYALCPELNVYQRQLKQEQQQLKKLADWVYQFSSMVSIIEPQSLLLEVRGSLKLFGGLDVLMEKIETALQTRWKYKPQMSVAPTPLAAQLFSQAGENAVVEQLADLRSALAAMPIDTLLLNDFKLLKKLNNIGVSCLQDLWRLPRDGLARRFGQGLVNHLDKLLGERHDPRHLHELPLEYDSSVELPMEAANHKSILIAVEQILLKLEDFLRSHDAGVTQLFIRLYHYDHPPENVVLGFRQNTRSAVHMLELLEERLNRLKLFASVTEVRLMVKEIIPFVATSHSLFAAQILPPVDSLTQEGIKSSDPEWESMLEQLQNRLGEKAVLQLQVVDDHRPEYAWGYGEPQQSRLPGKSSESRPTWILPGVKHLVVRNGIPWLRGPLCFLEGPERIESGWWQGEDICRDYYVARDIDNSRLWIFCDLKQKNSWYLQGYF